MSRGPDTPDKDDDGLLSRWSRRKRAVAAEAAEAAEETAPVADCEVPPVAEETLTEPELLEKLGLPDPDTLQKGDDFAAFMQANVPAALRRRALHRLWRSDPVLANLDGLIDHGEDYTDAATVPDVLTTAYKVGRGFLRDLVADAPEPEADGAEDAAIAVQDKAEAAPVPDPSPADPADPASSTDTDATTDAAEPEPPKPRRMAFRQS